MATQWQIGDRIQNRWEIHKILKGGMGIVYIVYDHEGREALAAKTFQDEVFGRNPVIARRFKQEAHTWVNLEIHQNTTHARFVENIEGKPFLFLEYVSGGDLGNWIGTPRLTDDLPQVLRFAIQFCDGMTHALSKGITAHRDIKPENCLVTQDNILKVTDFGLAKAFDDTITENWGSERKRSEASERGGLWGSLFGRRHTSSESDVEAPNAQGLSSGLTRTGVAAGTPTHMAPEQFEDAKHVDVRADIYSFGIMLFQMIAGKLPFRGQTWQDFKRLHKTQSLPELKTQNLQLKAVIQTCLAKDPASRFAGFSDLRECLVKLYESLTKSSAPQPAKGEELDLLNMVNRAHSLYNLGLFDAALDAADKCIRLNPTVADCWSNKGAILSAIGHREEALRCYDQAIALRPSYHQAWVNKGASLIRLGKYEEAIFCCDNVLASNPQDPLAWTNKGHALTKLERNKDALECLDQALHLNPWIAEAWNNRGVALMQLVTQPPENLEAPPGSHFQQAADALESYHKALEVKPNYKNAQLNLQSAFDFILNLLPGTYQSEPWLCKTAASDSSCLEKLLNKVLLLSKSRNELHPRYIAELNSGPLAAILKDKHAAAGLLVEVMGEVCTHYADLATLVRSSDALFRLGLHSLNYMLTNAGLLQLPTISAEALHPSFRKTIGETLQLAKSMNDTGIMYRRLEEYNSALYCYKIALELYELAGDHKFQGHIHYNRAIVYGLRNAPGDIDQASAEYSLALNIYQKLGLKEDMNAVHIQLQKMNKPTNSG